MSFNPKLLPPTVYDVYKQEPIAWMVVIQRAIAVGITVLNQLTDIAFYLHNPGLKGRPLSSDEIKLIAQWKVFQTLIKPMLSAAGGKTGSKSLGSPYVEVEMVKF